MKPHFFSLSTMTAIVSRNKGQDLVVPLKETNKMFFDHRKLPHRTEHLLPHRIKGSLRSTSDRHVDGANHFPSFPAVNLSSLFRLSTLFSLHQASLHAIMVSKRQFVDAPMDSAAGASPIGMDTSFGDSSAFASSSSAVVDTAYVYPLDIAGQKLQVYGELNTFSVDDSHRVISSNRLHSYDPSILSAELRLQDNFDGVPTEEVEEVAGKDAGKIENDAVMREGRNKQGAAGAAAVAAAVLESRRAVDGIALIPGHPLPVVFPRPDDLPPPLRFIKKFGPGGSRQTTSKGKARSSKELSAEEEEEDGGIYSEVLESGAHVESLSFQKSYAFQVRVLDEHYRPTKVKGFHHFSDLEQSLPQEVLQGISRANFSTPTLMQSVVMPLLLNNKDIICVAPPTSGCSFSIAIRALTVLHNVISSTFLPPESSTGTSAPFILVLCRSEEAAQRVNSAFRIIAGKDVDIVRLVGGKDENKQTEQLRQASCHVLIATPKHLSEAISSKLVQLHQIHFIAAVEVDRMLQSKESTFPEDNNGENELSSNLSDASVELDNIFRLVHDKADHPQCGLWCHSLTTKIQEFAGKFLSCTHLNTVNVEREEKVRANLRHVLYALKQSERLDCIWKLYDSHAILKREQVLIFCLFKETAEYVAKELTKLLDAPSSIIRFLHRGVRTSRRRQIMKDFERGDCRILVTTDAVTRKLDVPELEHIINYDLAPSVEVLSRRIGQIGQSGRTTTIHTFLVPEDGAVPLTAKFISEQTGKPLSPEIMEMVRQSEASGGGDTWSTPVIRFRDHQWGGFRWRVSGKSHYGGKNRSTTSEAKNEHLERRRELPLVLKAKELAE